MEIALWASLICILLVASWRLFLRDQWLKPRILQAKLKRQGIHGPPRSFLSGNLGEVMKLKDQAEAQNIPGINHDIAAYVQPHLDLWAKTYGFPFCMWWASEPAVVLMDLEMIKEVLYNKTGAFWKPVWQMKLQADLLGKGLVVAVKEEWAFRRRIMTPAFHHDRIKGMVSSMVTSVSEMLDKWDYLTKDKDGPVEIEVCKEFLELTADIISRTAFGSSYKLGQTIFKLLGELSNQVFHKFTSPWIKSLLPICKVNQEIKRLHKQLDSTLEEIIQPRLRNSSDGYGSDLLGLMLHEADVGLSDSDKRLAFTMESLKEECKTFYIAGHETSSRLLSWTMLLIAINQEWQDRARVEVLEVCKSGLPPDAEALNKLKVVGMVLNESLRLYPPAVFLIRTAYEDTRLGSLEIPAGVGVVIPVLKILHDEQVWGEDVNEFNPQRFADGVANASKCPSAFLPFGQGQRVCIGQSFAITEAKIALAMVLQKYSFTLSPKYKHSPVLRLALIPKHGIPLLVQKL